MRIVSRQLLEMLTAEAQASPRQRMNHNFHPDDGSCCHRLLNAIEPSSYIRPHRHLDPEKDESFVLIRGRLGIVLFDDNGTVAGTAVLSHETGNLAADVPHGVFHTAVSLETGTVFFEAKAGPYRPLSEDEKGVWACDDKDPAHREYLEGLRRLFD